MSLSGAQEEVRNAGGSIAASRLRVLSLSTVFPNPNEWDHGTFVRSRLQAIANLAEVTVIAPVPVVDYSNPRRAWFENLRLPQQRQDGPVEVLHPRWLFPPFGTPLNGLCLFLRLWLPLARLRRRYRFDLIDAHFGYPEGLGAALLAAALGCPFQVTLRGSEPIFSRSRWRRRAIAWSLRKAAHVIAVSEELRGFAVSLGADPRRTSTVPNGIDAGFFCPRDRKASRAKYGIGDGTRVILSAGRLVEAKGHHYILRALRNLLDRGVDAELLIAGGPCREDRFEQTLRNLVQELGLQPKVRLLGHVSREGMADLFSAADIFCLGSFMEGWPNVIHEAQACGTPVVSTRVGGALDMIPSEEFGYLVPIKDAAAMEEALFRALGRTWDRQAISLWGRSRSWEQVAREVVDQMTQVVAEGQQGTHVRN
jgi:teichuronic acid biosynthesis glycosyltransferase TuaC